MRVVVCRIDLLDPRIAKLRRFRMKKFMLFLSLAGFALLGATTFASPAGPGYHLIKKVPLGAAPGGGEYFDYVTVDSAARRVYLSHCPEVQMIGAPNFSFG